MKLKGVEQLSKSKNFSVQAGEQLQNQISNPQKNNGLADSKNFYYGSNTNFKDQHAKSMNNQYNNIAFSLNANPNQIDQSMVKDEDADDQVNLRNSLFNFNMSHSQAALDKLQQEQQSSLYSFQQKQREIKKSQYLLETQKTQLQILKQQQLDLQQQEIIEQKQLQQLQLEQQQQVLQFNKQQSIQLQQQIEQQIEKNNQLKKQKQIENYDLSNQQLLEKLQKSQALMQQQQELEENKLKISQNIFSFSTDPMFSFNQLNNFQAPSINNFNNQIGGVGDKNNSQNFQLQTQQQQESVLDKINIVMNRNRNRSEKQMNQQQKQQISEKIEEGQESSMQSFNNIQSNQEHFMQDPSFNGNFSLKRKNSKSSQKSDQQLFNNKIDEEEYIKNLQEQLKTQNKLIEESDKETGKRRNQKVWTKEEDFLLKYFHQKFKGKWDLIAEQIPGRNASQSLQRYRKFNNQKSTRSHWTHEEDRSVLDMIKKYGKNWGLIASNLTDRSGKQVRERYINCLDPEINWDEFTPAEDQLITQFVETNGAKWSLISKLLPGRPENMLKNRYYAHLKRIQDGLEPSTRKGRNKKTDKIQQKEEDKISQIDQNNTNYLSEYQDQNSNNISNNISTNNNDIANNLKTEEVMQQMQFQIQQSMNQPNFDFQQINNNNMENNNNSENINQK